jgi:AraC family transcriptional activator of tynA and feaB
MEHSVMNGDWATTLDLRQVERRNRQGAWEQAVAERLLPMGVDFTNAPDNETHGTFQSLDLSDIKVTEWDCPALKVVRTKRWIEATDTDTLMLLTGSAGNQHFEWESGVAEMEPGTAMIATSRMAYASIVPSGLRKRSVTLPLAALAPYDTGGQIPDCLVLDQSRPLARVLIGFVDSIGAHVESMDATEIDAMREALLTLVAGVIRSSTHTAHDGPALLPALRSQLEQWIKEHLRNGPIRVVDMAKAFSVSSRTVHRAFALTGDTVGSVVRTQRLAGARRDVLSTSLPIGSIARRWGYYDASHFGREFRNFLAMSPSDYRDCFKPSRADTRANIEAANSPFASAINELAG